MIETVKTWHAVVEQRDIKKLESLLDDTVVFYSPVVHAPQQGKDITMRYLSAAMLVFVNPSFHYINEAVSERSAALEFEVDIDGIHVNGIDMIYWDDDGRIIEFKVFIRPLKAINLVQRKMSALLKHEH